MSKSKFPKTGKFYPDDTSLLNGGRVEGAVTPFHDKGGADSPHHLVELRQPPASLTTLREELALPQNKDISEYAIQGKTFEECIGRVAMFLAIVLDGDYDVGPLCSVLVDAMRNRHLTSTTPHLAAAGLVNVELVEREGDVTLEGVDATEEVVAQPKIIATEH